MMCGGGRDGNYFYCRFASDRCVAVGFRRWKAAHLRPLLSMAPEGVVFVKDAAAARKLPLHARDCLVHWGRDVSDELLALAADYRVPILHLEDGFYRSVGLGSDRVRPHSIVLDAKGLYFDPRGPSDLEVLLNTADFDVNEITRARRVRKVISDYGLTKYNTESIAQANWPSCGKEVIFVPGQVEDDASIVHGCSDTRTNLGLLQAVRGEFPNAFIVYKPHPDVVSGNRLGGVESSALSRYADLIERQVSVVSCIEASDAVHTMTSTAGFDALLRGKPVVVHGRPFYAGWGLTDDKLRLERRTRHLNLDELVAGTLLRYPLYWDWKLGQFTTCERVLLRLIIERDRLAGRRRPVSMSCWWRRQLRKALGRWESQHTV